MIAAAPIAAELARWGVPLGARVRVMKGEHAGLWAQQGRAADGRFLVGLRTDDAGAVRRLTLTGLLTPEPRLVERNGLLMQVAVGVALPGWPWAEWLTTGLVRLGREPDVAPVAFGDGWAIGLVRGEAPAAVHLTIVGVCFD